MSLLTPQLCLSRFGDPIDRADEGKYMVMWDVPQELEVGVIPKKLYCNRLMIKPLTQAIQNLISTGCINELKTFDGCFNVRVMRGYEKKYDTLIKAKKFLEAAKYLSIHCWGLAIDLNQAWNQLNKIPTLSAKFVKCFTDAGFDWGGSWERKDGMHFQLRAEALASL